MGERETIYILEGEHPFTPGRRLSYHRTRERAAALAADLVNLMLADLGKRQDATADNWRAKFKTVAKAAAPNRCLVDITSVKLED